MNCGSVLDRGRIDLRQNGLKPPDASRKRITITIDRVSHLRGVQRIDLGAALAVILEAYPIGQSEKVAGSPSTNRFLGGTRCRWRMPWSDRRREIEPHESVRLQSTRRIEGYRGAIDI